MTRSGKPVPDGTITFIANDGNLLPNPAPIKNGLLPVQGTAERSTSSSTSRSSRSAARSSSYNVLQHDTGLLPKQTVSLAHGARRRLDRPGGRPDHAVPHRRPGRERRRPGHHAQRGRLSGRDHSQVLSQLTDQIPLVTPVRTRVVEWGRGGAPRSTTRRCRAAARRIAAPRCRRSRGRVSVNGGAGARDERQPRLARLLEAGRHRALDLQERRRRVGSPDPPALRGGHHLPAQRSEDRRPDREPGPQGRVASRPLGQRHLPDPVRRVRRLLREPLPQHGARGLRAAHADPAA